MASDERTNRIPEGAASPQPSGGGLPAHLARLVNPKVFEMRRQQILSKVADAVVESDRRRRYIETIVDHLRKELERA
ncbi:MAG TPA: hypothetical protein VFQ76_07210 [Longimicrobiaceae bacterium]|nr:hypothetical protein [Longimicrobiaceae bacterium]